MYWLLRVYVMCMSVMSYCVSVWLCAPGALVEFSGPLCGVAFPLSRLCGIPGQIMIRITPGATMSAL